MSNSTPTVVENILQTATATAVYDESAADVAAERSNTAFVQPVPGVTGSSMQPSFWKLDLVAPASGVLSSLDLTDLTATSESVTTLLLAETKRLSALKDAYDAYLEVFDSFNPPSNPIMVPLVQKQNMLDTINLEAQIVKAQTNLDLAQGRQRAMKVETDAAVAQAVVDCTNKVNTDFPTGLV